VPALEARGHAARAIDLPAHGEDATPVAAASLEAYAASITGALTGPTLLVGHSAGGVAITAAAERDPGRVAGLVYLCAYALADGESLAGRRRQAARQPLMPAVRRSPDGASFTVDPELAPGIFYHDCPPEAVAYALPRLCAEPVAPQETPLRVTARSAGLPRHYVLCTEDRTIPPEEQERMVSGWPEGSVTRLPSGHSPFFAMPDPLAALIDAVAGGLGAG
jgi:pimeloyl-ACP methyl ester carboxylesterase